MGTPTRATTTRQYLQKLARDKMTSTFVSKSEKNLAVRRISGLSEVEGNPEGAQWRFVSDLTFRQVQADDSTGPIARKLDTIHD
jgi:hypothetical protein